MLDFLTPQSFPEHTLTSKEEMAIGALGSTPGFFSALSQVLHRSFPPFFDASLPCTCCHCAGKRQGKVAVQMGTTRIRKLSCCQDIIVPLSWEQYLYS